MRSFSPRWRAAAIASCVWLLRGASVLLAQGPVDAARVSLIEGEVKLSAAGASTPLREGQSVAPGSSLQTGAGSLARIEVGPTSVLLGGATEVRLSGTEMVLERGRIEVATRNAEVAHVAAANSRISGEGWAVVRREGERVQLSAIEGRFSVKAGGREAIVTSGHGLSVSSGQAPGPVALTQSPRIVFPGVDAPYFQPNAPFDLKWQPAGKAHVQILALTTDDALVDRDVDGESTSVKLAWPGLYRWRIASLGEGGVEGAPSTEGLICILDPAEGVASR